MSKSILNPAKPLLLTTIGEGKFTVTVVCVGVPVVGLKVAFIGTTVGAGFNCT